jgi:hypothetical protein
MVTRGERKLRDFEGGPAAGFLARGRMAVAPKDGLGGESASQTVRVQGAKKSQVQKLGRLLSSKRGLQIEGRSSFGWGQGNGSRLPKRNRQTGWI